MGTLSSSWLRASPGFQIPLAKISTINSGFSRIILHGVTCSCIKCILHFIKKEVLWQVQLSCLFLLIAVVIAAEEKKTQKHVSLGINKFDVDSLKEKVR